MNSESTYAFATVFGWAGIVYHPDPFALKRIILPQADEKSLRIQMNFPAHISKELHPLAEKAGGMICAFFSGERIDIPWQWLDMNQFTPAENEVYRQVARIAYGGRRSYGQIACDVGRPRAARFVGRCMADNPYPVLIPCHRVIRSDGALGGFRGGLMLKQRMLELESAH